MTPLKRSLKAAAISAVAVLSVGILPSTSAWAGTVDPDADYDRLDGHGKSGEKVNVIEWEDNLEIHVYPKGSLKGLALKLDKKNKDKPVMVIGYRFNNSPSDQLIRRAILGISIAENFKVFQDPSEPDFDKIVISNNGLASPLVAYNLEPEPKQLYPDGHPALANGNASTADGATNGDRELASTRSHAKHHVQEQKQPEVDEDQDTGTIRPFYLQDKSGFNRSGKRNQ